MLFLNRQSKHTNLSFNQENPLIGSVWSTSRTTPFPELPSNTPKCIMEEDVEDLLSEGSYNL